MMKIKQFKNIPFIEVSPYAKEKLKNRKFLMALVDVFDEDFWSSKISVIGNSIIIFFIIISSLEVVFSTGPSYTEFHALFNFIDVFSSIFFTIEVILRIALVQYKSEKYKGFKGFLRYNLSFYGLIDLIAIIPFWGNLLGISVSSAFKILRIFRVWRIVRFIPAFEFISNALRKKSDEILVSLLGVVIMSTTISAFLYYAEYNAGHKTFESIIDALKWSIGKYTGDYGSIAVSVPKTMIGGFLATINGVLGIALFALPAGILGSAFIDELGEQKHSKEVQNRIYRINKHFDESYIKRPELDKTKVHIRYFTFESLQASLLLTDDEILECVRESDRLRFRSMKSSDDVKYNDVKIIERYSKNRSYGAKILNDSNIYIVNTMGAAERCLSHFCETIVGIQRLNYISRENKFYTTGGNKIPSNFSVHYKEYGEINNENLPRDFNDFMNDLTQINSDNYVFVICTGASGRADFTVEYGNKKGEIKIEKGVSTINDEIFFSTFIDSLNRNASNISVDGRNRKKFDYSFTIEQQTVGNADEKWIGKTIHRLTKASVVTIYVNIKIITGENTVYYAALKALMNAISEVKSLKK